MISLVVDAIRSPKAAVALSSFPGASSMSSSSSSSSFSPSCSSSLGSPCNTFYTQVPLLIKRLSENATLPKRGSDLAAGLDLCSSTTLTIPAGQRQLVPTDLALCCPPGTYGRIAPRSGLALNYGIDVGAGVIDADYRGPVGVILFNWGTEEFHIRQGDRIAQLILERIVLPEVEECTTDLPESVRGVDGFGSTGVGAGEIPASASNKKPRTVSPTSVESGDENKF
ncbi:hypothetical protein ACA910_005940 [Epithemia clementina (nom. ined.)]